MAFVASITASIIKNIVKIALSGIFGLIGLFALLLVFSVEMNQGFLAYFFARLIIFLIISVVAYLSLSLFLKSK